METRQNRPVVLVICALAIHSPSSALADIVIQIPVYSPDIHLDHTKRLVADENAAYPFGPGLNLFSLGELPGAMDVDAIHGLPGGEVLFSIETSVILNEVLYRPCDVIRFDGHTWSMAFDGRAAGIPAGVNLDALAMSGETLLFSIDTDAQLGLITADDSDVIAYDGIDFSIFLDAANAGVERAADLDALHVDGLDRLLVSFDGAGELGGVDYSDEDMLAWDSQNWSLEFDGSVDDGAWSVVDLDAWSVVFIDDNIFADGFE